MTDTPPALRIGTRGSTLALWQARHVASRLEAAHAAVGLKVELEIIKTTGDKVLDTPLAKIGGKGLFIKEIEEALAAGRVDLAVHSMKDVPATLPAGFALAALLERADARDGLIGKRRDELTTGVHVGTSSLRRSSQLLERIPGLKVSSLRGNVDTRLRKLDEGQYDAIVLAVAGLQRLGLGDRVTDALDPDWMMPGVAQGAIGIETREEDGETGRLVAVLHHDETARAVRAERAFLRRLGGTCQVPFGAWARRDPATPLTGPDAMLLLDGLVAMPDGSRVLREQATRAARDPEDLGNSLAEALLSRGADEIVKALEESADL